MFSQLQLSDHSAATTKANRRLWPILLTGLLGFSAQAQAWWSDDWAFRKPITLDAKAAGVQGDQANMPVLIRLHEGVLKLLMSRPMVQIYALSPKMTKRH